MPLSLAGPPSETDGPSGPQAEVVAVDLATGRIVSRSRSFDGGAVGNLASCQGAVFSQTVEGLSRFDLLSGREAELAAAERSRPGDPQGMAERGEICSAKAVKRRPSKICERLLRRTRQNARGSGFAMPWKRACVGTSIAFGRWPSGWTRSSTRRPDAPAC